MRDWNSISDCTSSGAGVRLDLTYEGLKLAAAIAYGAELKVWILPMRDWNSPSIFRVHRKTYVWILPMRDWNLWRTGRTLAWRRFGSYLWGIETPQHRCHSIQSRRFGSYLWGIETIIRTNKYTSRRNSLDLTYEGLKLSCIKCIFPEKNVWILPMRDWNCINFARRLAVASVWILPMRDWNAG